MSGVNTYKELIIWQKGIRLVVLVYKLTEKFPRDEIYALTSQIRKSISLNSIKYC